MGSVRDAGGMGTAVGSGACLGVTGPVPQVNCFSMVLLRSLDSSTASVTSISTLIVCVPGVTLVMLSSSPHSELPVDSSDSSPSPSCTDTRMSSKYR